MYSSWWNLFTRRKFWVDFVVFYWNLTLPIHFLHGRATRRQLMIIATPKKHVPIGKILKLEQSQSKLFLATPKSARLLHHWLSFKNTDTFLTQKSLLIIGKHISEDVCRALLWEIRTLYMPMEFLLQKDAKVLLEINSSSGKRRCQSMLNGCCP